MATPTLKQDFMYEVHTILNIEVVAVEQDADTVHILVKNNRELDVKSFPIPPNKKNHNRYLESTYGYNYH